MTAFTSVPQAHLAAKAALLGGLSWQHQAKAAAADDQCGTAVACLQVSFTAMRQNDAEETVARLSGGISRGNAQHHHYRFDRSCLLLSTHDAQKVVTTGCRRQWRS